MEFHISRAARDRYQFDQSLFTLTGNVIFADFHATRVFAGQINQTRDLVHTPEQAVKAGQINAMGLIDEILHYVVGLYREQKNPALLSEAVGWLEERIGREAVDAALRQFADEFPPVAVYQRRLSLDAYMQGETEGVPNRLLVLEEMLMLWLANANPAFAPFLELFDDQNLEKESSYLHIMSELDRFLDTQPGFGPENEQLIQLLRSPALAVPHSLSGQLEYIREKWGLWLGQYFYRLLSSLDLIKEEEKAIFLGPGPAQVYDFTGQDLELERFSQDRDWMPSLVLIAKNSYVWLDQLSKQYRQDIYRLDQIPDEALDKLADWGFSGLWLIGLWERSQASKRIKQMCGNPEAVASAYSLFDYQIAEDLGGDSAYQNLRDRAWQRGIRLASDMVPNHMAIDSKWVVEHPDWFISQDYSPFFSYSFNGPNLSWDERVGIYLEDHYYSREDAAVVFKRVDHRSGTEQYIYHGNDGTSMPWNDTAQLDYLNPEMREAIIQTILHVARHFPIIRFDAAMTLAKKHFQRLWYPEPGTGGAIPSRAEHSLTRAQLDALMPQEFWREVVDRVAQEAPDTLLLAEAFWLMEGYFVRTLGMHRVYNSAFMNILRDEENSKYRSVMKNTLEFDPEVMKRFVNFMNNPDERTAVDQFGKDDKYFGICTMMATLPGLPMFGHGQIEGFSEKYGMEYRRAYWDEQPDPQLVERHQREIFPLLRRRYLFAEVENFLLYDVFTAEGYVNEDVFAYSNRVGDQRSLVIYHNKFADARGWIKRSVGFSVKTGQGDERQLVQRDLIEGLALNPDPDHYCVFREQVSGLEFIRSNREMAERGLYLELGAYKYNVFLDFRQVKDSPQQPYAQLHAYLSGAGVPSIDQALTEIVLQPVHHAFQGLVNADMLRQMLDSVPEPDPALLDTLEQKTQTLLDEVAKHLGVAQTGTDLAGDTRRDAAALLQMPGEEALEGSQDQLGVVRGALFGWLFTHALGKVVDPTHYASISRSWIDEWLLGKSIAAALDQALDLDEAGSWQALTLCKVLVSHQDWCASLPDQEPAAQLLMRSLLADSDVQQLLQINRYQDLLWFNGEAFELLLTGLSAVARVQAGDIQDCQALLSALDAAREESGYQVEKLLAALA